jgi:FMN phosphatase YigB (HAD superfamily)
MPIEVAFCATSHQLSLTPPPCLWQVLLVDDSERNRRGAASAGLQVASSATQVLDLVKKWDVAALQSRSQ